MSKIMIVDEDQQLARVIAHKLRKAGHQTVVLANGEEALRALPAEKPDLVLLEIVVPGINGFELMRRAQADPALSAVLFIVLSSRNLEEDVLRGLELGAIDYMTKPVSVNILCAKITNVLKYYRGRP